MIDGTLTKVMVLFALFFGVDVAADDDAPADALTAINAGLRSVNKQSVNDVTVEVSIPKTVRAGEKIDLTVVVSNNGTRPVWCGDVGHIIQSWVKAVDSKSKEVPYTIRGENLLSERPHGIGMYSRWALQPGKSHYWCYDIQQSFEFSKGSHKLSLETKLRYERDGKPFTIRVQDVPFQIE